MKVDLEILNKIYQRLGDDESKEIFKNRFMYSLSGDWRWILKNLDFVHRGGVLRLLKRIEECSSDGGLVIYGAGKYGRYLLQILKKLTVKCYIDSSPEHSELQGIPVVETDQFLNNYCGEYIVISSSLFYHEMYKILAGAGIPDEKIINLGEMIYEAAAATYFDLEYLKPADGKEIFLDVGGFDGKTTMYFSQWCKKDAFSYIFEPDQNNINKCHYNLRDEQIDYQMIPKGAWSSEGTLQFCMKGAASSRITEDGEASIPVTTIDKEMSDKKVTYIKMDIEGAEREALLGAQKTIMCHTPKLAVSVYHKPQDIWEIPAIILQYHPSYRLFLRHYTLFSEDTVLYALPG